MEAAIKLSNISPEISANPISRLFFCWVLPFFKYGASHTLQYRDIYDTVDGDSVGHLKEELEKNWNYELKQSRIKNRRPDLKKSLFYSFGYGFMLYGFYLFLQSVVIRILQPIVLAEYIRYFTDNTVEEENVGYWFAVVVILLALLNNLIYHHCYFGCSRIGTRAKVACSSLIQNKVLKLSQYSLSRTSPTRLAKLLSDDVKKIEAAAPYLHYLLITPIQFLASIYISYHTIGVSCFAGLIFMLIVAIPQGYMSVLLKEIEAQLSVFTDSRVKIMKEILLGIRLIKIYGWENPFKKILEKSRKHEINVISKKIFVKCFSMSTVMFTQSIAVFLTLSTNVLVGNDLKTETVFGVVLIFNNLQQYLCYFFPEAMERYVDLKIALAKIENFLIMEEKEEQIKIISYSKGLRKPGICRIQEASAKWGTQPVLQDINLKINSGTSTCIYGAEGSGKTSLMQMILKELPAISGRVDVVGTISYASQKPWVFPGTIKSNILFGQPYNRHKYREILKICCLDNDLKKLPYGDQTLACDKSCIENGIREKINLARSFYKDADIYIIDDSFGNIDFQTEKHIFSEGVTKYLKNKTRIFVSNKLYYAKEADKIAVVENGIINRIIDSEDFTEADFVYLNTKLNLERNNFASSCKTDFVEETDINNVDIEHKKFDSLTYKRGYFVTLGEFFKFEKRHLVEAVAFLIIIPQIMASLSDYWLTQWIGQDSKNVSHSEKIKLAGDHGHKNSSFLKTSQIIYHTIIKDVIYGIYHKNSTGQEVPLNKTEEKIFGVAETDFFISCYAGFIISCIILTVIRTLLYHAVCMNASRALHSKMFVNVLFSPMKFFEAHPTGRILQRFSKDLDVVNNLSIANFATWQMYSALCGTTFLMLFTSPATILPLLLILLMVYLLISAFVSTIRGLQKLENSAHIPVCSFLSTSLQGVFTIRSGKGEQHISEVFENLVDRHTGIWVTILATNEYFCLYMDMLAVLFMAITVFFVAAIKMDYYYYSQYIGLAVTQGLILTELLHLGLRESMEAITNSSTVDGALQYTKLATEDVEQCTLVPKNWPYCGKVMFKNVYITNSDLNGSFLKNLNIVFRPAEKVAIVSRYPEEKWTIMTCLLRLTSIEGLVILDDVDTSSISFHKLRYSIAVITKDPVLFSGSVRYNLDPFDNANDDMLWKVLEEVGLKTSIQSLSQPIIEGGFNFSYGQRHLLCLARALLKNSKLLIIENGRTNIDTSTESFMQKIIKEKFKNCTVITIANSLNTIMDNDKILVIEDGKEVEYAHAHELLQNPEGYLSYLVKETGPNTQEKLRKIAKDNFESRNLQIQFKFD